MKGLFWAVAGLRGAVPRLRGCRRGDALGEGTGLFPGGGGDIHPSAIAARDLGVAGAALGSGSGKMQGATMGSWRGVVVTEVQADDVAVFNVKLLLLSVSEFSSCRL